MEYASEREEIGARVYRIRSRLLGRHVRRRSFDHADAGRLHPRAGSSDAEVAELHVAVPREKNVPRRHVAVNDRQRLALVIAFLVRVLERARHFLHDVNGHLVRHRSIAAESREIGAFDQWWGIVGQIRQDWDNICGDTFCGGDYSNLHALAFSCSVKKSTGVLSRCKWVFAGSYETVNTTYGTISTHANTWSCNISVSGVKLTTLMDLLGKPSTIGDEAIQRKLPSGKSLYDSLGDCLP